MSVIILGGCSKKQPPYVPTITQNSVSALTSTNMVRNSTSNIRTTRPTVKPQDTESSNNIDSAYDQRQFERLMQRIYEETK